jgi:hypothetical protein
MAGEAYRDSVAQFPEVQSVPRQGPAEYGVRGRRTEYGAILV